MRVRSKISYHAFRKQMTVNELFMNVIVKSYRELTQAGEIPPSPYSQKSIKLFEDLLESPMRFTIDGLIELANDPIIKQRKDMLYKYKEMRLLGIHNIDELDPTRKRSL